MVTVPWIPHEANPTQATVFFYFCKSWLVGLYTLSRGCECSVSLNISLLGLSAQPRGCIYPEYISKRWIIGKRCFLQKHYHQLRFRTNIYFFKWLLSMLQYCFCFTFWLFGHQAYGILALQPGINPLRPALEGEVLTTGPSRKSLGQVFTGKLFIMEGFPGNPVLEWQKHNWVTNTNQPTKQPKERKPSKHMISDQVLWKVASLQACRGVWECKL